MSFIMFQEQSDNQWANEVTGANSRPASPFEAGRQFGRASCAPPSLSAAVAQFCRSTTRTHDH